MEVCILMGSPKKKGNTAAILKPFIEELENYNSNIEVIWLYDCKIEHVLLVKSVRITYLILDVIVKMMFRKFSRKFLCVI